MCTLERTVGVTRLRAAVGAARVFGGAALAVACLGPIALAVADPAAAPGADPGARPEGRLPPTVFADGTGLPDGVATARAGAPLYAARCASCHGAQGEGARAVELVGDRTLLASDYPDRGIAVFWPYAPPLFDYVRRAMPPDAPYSLDAEETYAVVAYLLELNGLVAADTPVDAEFLAELPMPNAAGFDRAPD